MKGLLTKINLLFFIIFSTNIIYAQTYLGAGHGDIEVETSNEKGDEYTDFEALAKNTVNGKGLTDKQMAASRFLAQSTMGANKTMINDVVSMGIENWIENQFEIPKIDFNQLFNDIYDETYQIHLDNGGDPEDYGIFVEHFWYAWWENLMKNDDYLRQRIAYTLSEIMVVSMDGALDTKAEGVGAYYDMLLKNSFGNYEDLLMDVTLHAAMGTYLSHLNNSKAIPEENIHPDENYAREIMQLFSIGLFELNPDGSKKKDDEGNEIPTYDINDIKEFAKVFTGLGAGEIMDWVDWTDEPYFDMYFDEIDMRFPMKMYSEFHDVSEKHLLNGEILPAGQDAMKDIEDAVSNLFNHPNVGPFIGKQLIQKLIKSNPTPEYIERVSQVFNDNGEGIRGDMKSIITAILLDPEARDCSWISDPNNGKLKEPLLRYTHFCKAIDLSTPYGGYWNVGEDFLNNTGQNPLFSPSVFNFFLPDYTPNGPINDAGLVGPEFQIHNSRTSIGYINSVFVWTVYEAVMYAWADFDNEVTLNLDYLWPYAYDSENLVNKLDMELTHGLMTEETRDIIVDALNELVRYDWDEDEDYIANRIIIGLYLVMISPDYVILK